MLTGFMGTGKTSVGRGIAERMGRPFVDVDDWIAQHAGKPIQTIFDEDGEDRFRAWEAQACVELSQPRGLVIATGGWTLGAAKNREMLRRGGRVMCLLADAETILARLDGVIDRPLLAGGDRAAMVRALLNERESVYRSFAWQIDTARLDVAEVARRALALWSAISQIDEPDALFLPMPGVRAADGGTTIAVGTGLTDVIGLALNARGLNGRAALVTDSIVDPLHGDRIARSLAQAGIESLRLRVPAGEVNKSLESARALYDAFAAGEIERRDIVVALGGGMIGDLAGFAAATYLRGLRWVCVPTSLLAMVDASVGGKVAVDLPMGKNLVGAFHPPLATICDLDVLNTLPGVEFRSGLAEVIKAGLIADPELFGLIESGKGDLRAMIVRALQVKVDIVRADPFETGQRAALNLGHTIGHAIEAASNYSLRHGEAVAIGLIAESRIAERIGLARAGLSRRVESVISRVDLPTRSRALDLGSIWTAMRADKKKQGGRLKLTLPRDIGDVAIGIDVDDAMVREALREMLET